MLSKLAILSILGCIVGGCQGETVAPEPEASKAAGTAEASNWTPEQKAAFEQAHNDARSGKDEAK